MTDKQNLGPAHDYMRDAWERSILFLDVLRQRGNIYRQQQEKAVPNVLGFDAEPIMDGRALDRPVNYLLVRIVPPAGVDVDNSKRAFVVVDPRAGHGPGIGGMKDNSEIGAALGNGHPTYFIGFLPEPMPDQTIEDVWNAEARFIEEVSNRHPDSGKPVIIGNCQAGWQTMIMAATHPELPGPLLLAGSPLSYWAGVRGKNPMRYSGGILGGTWLTGLSGDLGEGKFDGANLVANFESLDPANTFFEKPYNVYANIDTETERFLEFETWWGSPITMNAGEMQWIADNLFVGNRLTSGDIRTSDGLEVDLRNIQSPIVVFCSWGDNITPPQQALGWITDIYRDDEDLIAGGQTIVYSLHQSVGHLGIFVSGKIATREHDEFASAMDMIDIMPPGLYEAIIEDVGQAAANRGLISGDHLFRLEPRTLDDIRALGGNTPEDEIKFATVDRVSTINRRLYEQYMQPFIRAVTPPGFGEWMRKMHPNRVRFGIFSDENPAMRLVAESAEQVRKQRDQGGEKNMFTAVEGGIASSISASLSALGTARDTLTEQVFHMTYGSPLLQSLVGLDTHGVEGDRKPGRDALRDQTRANRRAELEMRWEEGDVVEAALRSIIYVRQAEGTVDERGFAVLKQLHEAHSPGQSMAELKKRLRDQSLLMRLDHERAVTAIPTLLPANVEQRNRTFRAIRQIVTAPGQLSPEGKRRLKRIEQLFEVKERRGNKGSAHVGN